MIELILSAFMALMVGYFVYEYSKILRDLTELEKRIKSRKWDLLLKQERDAKNNNQ